MPIMQWLSSYSFMPHGYCFLWRPEILWLHVISDLAIVVAYFSIPLTLLYIMRKREYIPHKWVLAMFSGFIFMCSLSHIFGILTIWIPLYALEGVIKAVTAAFSMAAAILILPIVPRVIEAFEKMEKEKPDAQTGFEEI